MIITTIFENWAIMHSLLLSYALGSNTGWAYFSGQSDICLNFLNVLPWHTNAISKAKGNLEYDLLYEIIKYKRSFRWPSIIKITWLPGNRTHRFSGRKKISACQSVPKSAIKLCEEIALCGQIEGRHTKYLLGFM